MHDYLTKLRMDKARTLLASTGKEYYGNSGETGFRDYRVFHQSVQERGRGIPSAFRSRFSVNFPETC